jgi:hypothetical protein
MRVFEASLLAGTCRRFVVAISSPFGDRICIKYFGDVPLEPLKRNA